MVDDPREDLLLEILRRIQGDIVGLKQDVRDIKTTPSEVRWDLHSLRGEVSRQSDANAALPVDRERVKTRLDLRDL